MLRYMYNLKIYMIITKNQITIKNLKLRNIRLYIYLTNDLTLSKFQALHCMLGFNDEQNRTSALKQLLQKC